MYIYIYIYIYIYTYIYSLYIYLYCYNSQRLRALLQTQSAVYSTARHVLHLQTVCTVLLGEGQTVVSGKMSFHQILNF